MDYLQHFCIILLALLNAYTGDAQQVRHLEVDQAFNCCPNLFRSDPVIYCYKGREKNIIHLWETVQLHLNLASDEFEQFDGTSPEEVQSKFESRKASWYFNIYTTKKKVIKLNPFNTTCIGIVTKNDYAVKLTRIRVDYWKILLGLSGLILFLTAPKLSSNSLFYYLCGVSFGTCASLLILVFIISRLLPKKPMMYSFLVGGWTIGLYLVQFLWDNIRTIAMEYQAYVMYYIILTGVISFMICYRLGPVSDPRSINLITWLMQAVGLLLILFSSDFREATLAFDILLLTGYIIPFGYIFSFLRRWTKWFKPKPTRRLLSEDEYYQEGVRETAKALDELRGYCSSPECNQWKTVIKLRDPLRFAKFMEGSSHLDDEEVLAFETDMKDYDNDLLTDDDSSDSAS